MDDLFEAYPHQMISFMNTNTRIGMITSAITTALTMWTLNGGPPETGLFSGANHALFGCFNQIRLFHVCRNVMFVIQLLIRVVLQSHINFAARGERARAVTERLRSMTGSCWWKLGHFTGGLVQVMYVLASMLSFRCRHCFTAERAGDPVTHSLLYVMVLCICIFMIHTSWAIHRMDQILHDDEVAFDVVGEDRSSSAIAEHTSLTIWDAATDAKDCSICMTPFAAGDRVRVLRCKHEFHAACVDVWLVRRHKCPLCLREIDEPGRAGPSSLAGQGSAVPSPLTARQRSSTVADDS